MVQTLMKVEPSKMKWWWNLSKKWNVTIHPYNLEWESTFFLDLRREKKHVLLYTGSKQQVFLLVCKFFTICSWCKFLHLSSTDLQIVPFMRRGEYFKIIKLLWELKMKIFLSFDFLEIRCSFWCYVSSYLSSLC